MFENVSVIGAGGRVGSAVAARLHDRGLRLVEHDAELVLLCVPDRVISEIARSIIPGAWVAHVSGATPLSALDPHERRFSVHPLQTIVKSRGPEQLDRAWAAVTAETEEARARGFWLARTLGLQPFDLADEDKALYHAAAALVSGYLCTLHRVASSLFEDVGAPPQALLPLLQRTIDNDFELTGPISRGDWSTVEAHLEALAARRPELVTLYRALAEATAR